jgi:hypothetical protein
MQKVRIQLRCRRSGASGPCSADWPRLLRDSAKRSRRPTRAITFGALSALSFDCWDLSFTRIAYHFGTLYTHLMNQDGVLVSFTWRCLENCKKTDQDCSDYRFRSTCMGYTMFRYVTVSIATSKQAQISTSCPVRSDHADPVKRLPQVEPDRRAVSSISSCAFRGH